MRQLFEPVSQLIRSQQQIAAPLSVFEAFIAQHAGPCANKTAEAQA
jgi:hypothetical protein